MGLAGAHYPVACHNLTACSALCQPQRIPARCHVSVVVPFWRRLTRALALGLVASCHHFVFACDPDLQELAEVHAQLLA